MNRRICFACSLAIATAVGGSPALAQLATGVVMKTPGTRVANDPVVINAKPMVNRLRRPDTSRVKALTADTVKNLTPGFFVGSPDVPGATSVRTVEPRAFGSFGIPYTSTRVQAAATNQTSAVGGSFLGSTTPYRQIGKLFFNDEDGATHCSATLIRRSVIVTAAHCIQAFGAFNRIYDNWVFVPAHWGLQGATLAQRQPYGRWNWAAINRPVTWANGTDPGSGTAHNNDIAVIILDKNDRNQFLGDLIGWLGYGWNNYSFVSSAKTGNLKVAATSTLGYPQFADDGRIMQRADGPTYLATISGALQYMQGSNFTGGSSGGPWLVNFVSFNPALSGGAVIGRSPNRLVIGVTSWGGDDTDTEKENYSSRFGQNAQYPNPAYGNYGAGNIGALVQGVCNLQFAYGITYASAGYCD